MVTPASLQRKIKSMIHVDHGVYWGVNAVIIGDATLYALWYENSLH